jgi:hypothetical protein
MIKRACAVLLFAAAGCASQATIPQRLDSPVVAYPMSERILRDRDVASGFAMLVKNAGYGHRPDEQAGFLVMDDDGRLRVVPWPATNRHHAQQWSGAIPAGTVAVAHTHPSESPSASAHDCDEARRLGMPMFVLTPQAVVLIDARSGRPQAIAQRGWLDATAF